MCIPSQIAALIPALLLAPLADAQVSQGWTDVYDGPPGNQNDSGEVVLVDGQGNVVVTGFSLGITGALYTADVYTRKLSPGGALLWEARYDGGAQDQGLAMALDDAGNVYVAGLRDYFTAAADYVVIKYSPLGTEEWVLVWDAPSGGKDTPVAIGVDAEGYVYVTGTTQGGSYDLVSTLKINHDGSLNWEKHYAGPWLGDDIATDLEVTPAGELYISAISTGQTSKQDMTLLKYDSTGTLLWEDRYDDANSWDSAFAVELDPQGNVVVGGATGPDVRITVRRLDPSGVLLSQGMFLGTATSSEWMIDMKVDRAGNAVFAGTIADPSWDYDDFLTVKFDPAGTVLWSTITPGPGDAADSPVGMALDAMDNVYVAGYAQQDPLSYYFDGFVIKLGRDGGLRWSMSYNGPTDEGDVFFGAAASPNGDVYVSGYTDRGISGLDWITIQYLQEAPPQLAVSNLQRGQNAILTASDLRPGEKTWFLYSAQGSGYGSCISQLGDLCLDLLDPVNNLGPATADAAGVATRTALVPAGAPLRMISFQAVAIRAAAGANSVKTNAVAQMIQP